MELFSHRKLRAGGGREEERRRKGERWREGQGGMKVRGIKRRSEALAACSLFIFCLSGGGCIIYIGCETYGEERGEGS
jgi:hypothetical protein